MTKKLESGEVKIHGKIYKTVALRVMELREHHSDWSILTELVEPKAELYVEGEYVVMKATIADETGRVVGTGYAEERRSATQINKTSALENCETSAIGRALAACGYAGTEYASANEVENAIGQQNQMEEVRLLREAIWAEDATLVKKITVGLTKEQKTAVWADMVDHEKEAMKKLLEVKE